MLRVLAVADTHLRSGQAGRLIERLDDHLRRADAIVHAGDIVDSSVLDALARFAPVFAVRGNNDTAPDVQLLPDVATFDFDGCEVVVVHDSGAATGRARRLRRRFPHADLVIFGHSHIPWHETDVGASGHAQHHVNPGSAIQARRQPHCSAAVIELDDGQVVAVRSIPLIATVRHTTGTSRQV